MSRETKFYKLTDVDVEARSFEVFERAPLLGSKVKEIKERMIFCYLSTKENGRGERLYHYGRTVDGIEDKTVLSDFVALVKSAIADNPQMNFIAIDHMV